MEKKGESTEALKAIKNAADNTSWFGNTPHYWAEASLPLAYAVACVEVVCESLEKACILYNRIIEAWSDAGIKAIFASSIVIISSFQRILGVELLFGNATPFNDAPQRAHWQLLSFVIGDNHMFARIVIPPFLMTAPLGDESESMLLQYFDNLVDLQSWQLSSHQAGTSTSKTFSSGFSLTGAGSRYREIASLAFFNASSSVSPALQHPGSSGQ